MRVLPCLLNDSSSPHLRVIPQLFWRSVISRTGDLVSTVRLVAGRTRTCDLNHTARL
jgi:hypothetical protein